MPRTARTAIVVACALALVAGAWTWTRPEPADAPVVPGSAVPAEAPVETPRTIAPRVRAVATNPDAVAADEPGAARGRLTVKVTLAATGGPAAGARVVLTAEDGTVREAKTDAEGVARIEALLPSDFAEVTAELPGHGERSCRFDVHGGGESTCDVSLERVAAVVGVVREEDGRAIAGAHVEAAGDGSISRASARTPFPEATSGADGSFLLDPFPVERVKAVRFWAARHVSTSVDWAPGAEARLEVRLAPAAVITGVVRDPSGTPVVDARVRAWATAVPDALASDPPDFRAATDATGRYELDALPFDCTWSVVASAEGFVDSKETEGVALPASRQVASCDLDLRPGASIELVVIDPQGAPVTDAEFTVGGTNGWLGPDGRLTLAVSEPGACRAVLNTPRFPVRALDLDLASGERKTVEVRLDAGVPFRGVVVDDLGAPVAGAEIEASGRVEGVNWSRKAQSGADGRFRVEGLGEGAQTFVCSAGGHAYARLDAEAPAEDVRFVLPRHGSVSLVPRVRAGAARPATLDVKYMRLGDFDMEWYSDPWLDGAIAQSLSPGRWRIFAKADGLAATPRDVDVAVGANVDLGEIVLGPSVTLTGRVVDAQGKGVFDARLSINDWPYSPDHEPYATGPDGGFRIADLPPGPVEVEVSRDDWIDVKLTHPLSADSPPLVITLLRGGLLRGRVRDDTNSPVSDVEVVAASDGRDGVAAGEETLSLSEFGGFSQRLRAGRWRLRVVRDDAALATKVVDVAEGGETSVDFVVDR